MTKVLKAGGLWLLISIIVWAVSMWRWLGASDVSTGQIVAQLVVLPLALTLVFIGVLFGVHRLRQISVSAGAQASSSPDTSVPLGSEDPHPLGRTAWLLADAVTLTLGHDSDSAWSSARTGVHRPGLDATLKDQDDLPIFSARVEDIALDSWWLGEPDLPDCLMQPHVARVLQLLTPSLQHVLDVLGSLVRSLENDTSVAHIARHDPSDMPNHLSGVAQAVRGDVNQATHMLQVSVRLVWPQHWHPEVREAASEWMRRQAGALFEWAGYHPVQNVRWQDSAVESEQVWWREWAQILSHIEQDERPNLIMVFAADSAIDDGAVARMQAKGELFTARHQTGCIPGEGSVGLMFANRLAADLLRSQCPDMLCVSHPIRGQRERSADAMGRSGCGVLSDLFARLHAQWPCEASEIKVISDADHRASRTAELYEATLAVTPDADPMTSVIRLGDQCGDLGVARWLVPLAVAAAAVRSAEGACGAAWVAHVHDPSHRAVLAVASTGLNARVA
ncbi:MAG: hypothetical protein ACOYNB_05000 [Aquabacterium sp.]|uniref:hypothetical protein n=1 Tax=Aquabacterium sp. TaxID=1872578 RepID=UPI003BD332A9